VLTDLAAVDERIQPIIPGAELVIIDDALHLSNTEQPEIFTSALTGFFARS
jgi:pimeloyl-ACP methyl ester carboxylesterase